MVAPSNRRMKRCVASWGIFLLALPILPAQVRPATSSVTIAMSPKVMAIQKKAVDGDVRATELLGEAYLKGDGVTKDYKMAEHLFLLAAEQNDPAAQIYLGTMHCQGLGGIPRDPMGGAAWFHVAADQGFAEAQTDLGVQYLNGEGVPHNRVYGASWIQKAADQGFAGAEAILGVLYSQGRGEPRDYQKAVFWLRKAVKQGDAKAEAHLGYLYWLGKGVPQDYDLAFSFAVKSAKQDFPGAEVVLGDMYRLGLGRTRSGSQALTWYLKAAAHSEDPPDTEDKANAEIAIIWATGDGVPQDATKGVTIIAPLIDRIKTESDDGDSMYQIILGQLYETGCGVAQDGNKSLGLFQKAADQGDPEAESAISWLREHDTLALAPKPASVATAEDILWLQKGAAQNDPKAEVSLSCLLCDGKAMPRDYGKALALAKKAAAQHYPLAELEMGDLYRLGLGCDQDSNQAMTWYQKAAAHNEDPSTTEDRANVEIALIYATGNEDDRDWTRAEEIIHHLLSRIQSRAASGDAVYEVMLGELYEIGCVVPKDRNQALSLYQKAASQGDPDAEQGVVRIEEETEPPEAPDRVPTFGPKAV
jgi:TPR repeat protein